VIGDAQAVTTTSADRGFASKLDFDLLGDLYRVFDPDTDTSHGGLDLRKRAFSTAIVADRHGESVAAARDHRHGGGYGKRCC